MERERERGGNSFGGKSERTSGRSFLVFFVSVRGASVFKN